MNSTNKKPVCNIKGIYSITILFMYVEKKMKIKEEKEAENKRVYKRHSYESSSCTSLWTIAFQPCLEDLT